MYFKTLQFLSYHHSFDTVNRSQAKLLCLLNNKVVDFNTLTIYLKCVKISFVRTYTTQLTKENDAPRITQADR